MTERTWFSSTVRRVCLVEGEGCVMANDSVLLFRASDFDEAFRRAVELGRALEEEYRNLAGQLVRWRLKEVLSLDSIRAESLDGAEVHSSFEEFDPPHKLEMDEVFTPECSEPHQTF
ncbi:MAG: DUF4288 domain-containing protein [Myxococcota bacterium]|nr:DUF4288 domain-containing protein [Myxococcota bacterium]